MATAKGATKMMRADGYIPASVAARAIGVNVTTIYRQIERGVIQGAGVSTGTNKSWFVLVADLLTMYEDFPTIQKAIRQAANK